MSSWDPSVAHIDVHFTYRVAKTRAINLLKRTGNRGGRTFLSAFIVRASINTTYYTVIVKRIEVQAAVSTIYGYGEGSLFQKTRLAAQTVFQGEM